MLYYLESGLANTYFKGNGEFVEGLRHGEWEYYEVLNTSYYNFEDENIVQDFGQFMVYGIGRFERGEKVGNWKLYLITDKEFKKKMLMDLNYRKWKKEGEFKRYYTSGELAEMGNYKKDQLHGEIINYYPNHELYCKRYFKNGLKDGKHIYYYSLGQIKFHNNFVNDTLENEFKSFYPNGDIKEVSQYKGGIIDGVYQYYYQNSKLWVERLYDRGRIIEVRKLYSNNGELLDSGTLKNGNGTIKYYTEEGEVYLIRTYENGIQVNEIKY